MRYFGVLFNPDGRYLAKQQDSAVQAQAWVDAMRPHCPEASLSLVLCAYPYEDADLLIQTACRETVRQFALVGPNLSQVADNLATFFAAKYN